MPSPTLSIPSVYYAASLPSNDPPLSSACASTDNLASPHQGHARPTVNLTRFFKSHHTLSTAISVSTVSSVDSHDSDHSSRSPSSSRYSRSSTLEGVVTGLGSSAGLTWSDRSSFSSSSSSESSRDVSSPARAQGSRGGLAIHPLNTQLSASLPRARSPSCHSASTPPARYGAAPSPPATRPLPPTPVSDHSDAIRSMTRASSVSALTRTASISHSEISSSEFFYRAPARTPTPPLVLSPSTIIQSRTYSHLPHDSPSVPSTPSECHFILPPIDLDHDEIGAGSFLIPITLDPPSPSPDPSAPSTRDDRKDKGKAREVLRETVNRSEHAKTFSQDRKRRKAIAEGLRTEWFLSTHVPASISAPSRAARPGGIGMADGEDLMWRMVHAAV